MHGGGYETRQVPLFHIFVRIFSLDLVHDHTEHNQLNPSIKLYATNLQTRAEQKQKIVQGHG